MPAMISATMKISRPIPRPASEPKATSRVALIWGAKRCMTPLKSVEACSQASYSGWPISGQLATDAAGGRTRKSLARMMSRDFSTDSARELPSRMRGTSNTTTAISTSSVADQPSWPPRRARNRRCRGYRVTARISAQSIRLRKGWKI